MRVFCLLILFASFILPSFAQKNRAFVVGVGDYLELTDLQRTIGDADGYAGVFQNDLGFEVTKLSNPNLDEFLSALEAFKSSIESGDRVAFVFSGHGWSDGAQNYLALRDAPLQSTEFILKRMTVALQLDVLDELRSKDPELLLAIIDACRDNPFDLGTKSVTKGLVPQQTVPGTLVVYAAGAREKALDRLGPGDPSPYSVFTRNLLPSLRDPHKPLMAVFDQARSETSKLAAQISHSQRPAIYSDVSLGYCFADSCVGNDQDGASSNFGDETVALMSALSVDTLEAYAAFRASFPNSSSLSIINTKSDQLLSNEIGLVFRDALNGGGEGPEMVVVPPGRFSMGSPEDELGRDADEKQREIKIAAPFAAGRFEVTQGEWDACVSDGGCTNETRIRSKDVLSAHCERFPDSAYSDLPRAQLCRNWRNDKQFPAFGVAYFDAKDYVAWLNRRTGLNYRLLSESEWEYAARAGTSGPYSFENRVLTDAANFNDGTPNALRMLTPVGTYEPNPFGLFDMHGSVFEWVEDCYDEIYVFGNLLDGSPYSPGLCEIRVIRGGDWDSNAATIRSANRAWRDVGPDVDESSLGIGFRVARSFTN